MSSPTFVLVPGYWEGAGSFTAVAAKLKELGHEAVIAPLLSTGKPAVLEGPNKSPSMDDDVAAIRAVVQSLVQEDKSVMLVGHSAGGFLASHAVEGLTKGDRKAAGESGGVAGLAFVTGALFPVGHMHSAPPFCDIQDDKLYCMNPRQVLLNDLPDNEAEVELKKLQFQPSRGWDREITYAAWETLPSAFLICEKDQALPPSLQEQIAGMIAAKLIRRCAAGHCAQISQPDAVAEFLNEALSIVI